MRGPRRPGEAARPPGRGARAPVTVTTAAAARRSKNSSGRDSGGGEGRRGRLPEQVGVGGGRGVSGSASRADSPSRLSTQMQQIGPAGSSSA